ncbi:hypothetical protein M422DRAFT_33433 [Sphaerobolus stellatus SS14]|uniref:Uncharacterized protein n=1 Tax=Sphaerobolus stellatus (strain SS14) TaxID=990650 RepID=A0A0C9VKQ9_SPHS4|nr:hypothetical protein M422DRAFT_33433 [Sphaerobolus stellatus SS14]
MPSANNPLLKKSTTTLDNPTAHLSLHHLQPPPHHHTLPPIPAITLHRELLLTKAPSMDVRTSWRKRKVLR